MIADRSTEEPQSVITGQRTGGVGCWRGREAKQQNIETKKLTSGGKNKKRLCWESSSSQAS